MSPGTLYVVSTPVGNLEDITQRALKVLAAVDVIAAEDTRHTGRLLAHFGIKTAMVSNHEHNEATRAGELLHRLGEGQDIALVSDAGTPSISDPGYRLVNLAAAQGIKVVPIPGSSALLAALVVSGLPTDRFIFEGFLPRKKGRRTRLEKLAEFDGTVVIFESTLRIVKTLNDIQTIFGARKMALCRELTKLHEEVLRGEITQVLAALEGRSLKGECVLVIGKKGLK